MSDGVSILLIEDDPEIGRLLTATLHAAGFQPFLASTLAEAQRQVERHTVVLVILDLGMPDGEGRDFIRSLRRHSDLPIIVLSARQSELEKVQALNAGADDYLEKPFGVEELLARIRVALRRLSMMNLRDDLYEVSGLSIDRKAGEVARNGTPVHLSPIEFKLLMLLAQRPGRIFPHRELLKAVWGSEYVDDTHYLRIHMGRLRAKLEIDPSQPRYLLTELGIGYRLAAT